MSSRGLARKADELVQGKRMLLLDQEKCKPGMPAYEYLKKYVRSCGGECITLAPPDPVGQQPSLSKTPAAKAAMAAVAPSATAANRIRISENACMACLNRAKKTPGEAVRIVNLPAALTTNITHAYGENSFRLHGLPTPRPGTVLGLLGTNGIGKSTALRVLAGRLKPNLGRLKDPPDWHEVMHYYRGSDLQSYLTRLLQDEMTVASKVQLDTDFARLLKGRQVGEFLRERDQRGVWEELSTRLELDHLLEREIPALSGGELQRFAIACTAVREADVYLFDEPSSFLDCRQRMTATDVIRELVDNADADAEGGDPRRRSRYVVVVEHDLAVLDAMSDYVCCLYGEAGAYGVVTKIASVRNGINNFLAGYIPAENMRFRAEALDFKVSGTEAADMMAHEGGAGKSALGTVNYPARTLTRTSEDRTQSFTLHIEPGGFNGAEMIGMLGENGCGKTTFMALLAGKLTDANVGTAGGDSGAPTDGEAPDHSLAGLGVSYKLQHYAPGLRKFPGTVQELLEKKIQSVIADRLFRLLVMKPLALDALEKLRVKDLSGGELQRVAITICLGTRANIYLLDEPSAGLDCEQRIVASKVIRRWIVNHMRKTAFVIEHDFLMASACSDRCIVYCGTPGVECTARSPIGLVDGFNTFLKQLDVTFRRDPANCRPRVNKKGSAKDREQKAAGMHYIFDARDDPSEMTAEERAEARAAAKGEAGKGKGKKGK